MKKNIFRTTVFLLAVFCSMFVAAQSLDQKLAEIDSYAQKVLTDWNAPGFAIAIVKDDKVVFAKGYGVRELGKPDKVDENTLFAIASNSKAFTTASLAMLIDEKKIESWDDKVTKYLPDFQMPDPNVTREMTIRDLVSHRSGLDTFSGDLLWYDTTYTSDDVIKRIRYLTPKYGFRSHYGYQNLMFITAGKIVEKVSGKSWGQFVKERILTPLGMSRSTISVKDLKDNVASPHNESGGKLRPLPQGDVDNSWGACGVNSSVAELAKWLRLQLGRGTFEGKQIFSRARSAEMWSQNMFVPMNSFPAKNAPNQIFSGYGLGWALSDYYGKKLVGHSGGLDGMLSYTAMIPQENLGVVVLTNAETAAYQILRNKVLDVMLDVSPKRDWSAEALNVINAQKKAAEAEDAKIDAERKADIKPSLPLKGYAGTYSGKLYGDVIVTEENGKLVMRLIPAPNFVADLEHWEKDKFQIHWRSTVKYNFPRGWVNFVVDKTKKAAELKIDQPNNDFWFYELELKKADKAVKAKSVGAK